jgi:hypothetical protein
MNAGDCNKRGNSNSIWKEAPTMTIEKLEVLTPENPRWDEFADALYAAMDWRDGPEGVIWICDGDRGDKVHRLAKQVMATMGGVDIEGSLAFFKSHGGGCDCEILFNVDPSLALLYRGRHCDCDVDPPSDD